MKKFLKIIFVSFLILSVLFGVVITFYLDNEEKEVKKKTEFERYWLNIPEEKERVNILLMGVDPVEGKVPEDKARTDTMMILSVDPQSKTAFILSIPRDSRVELEGQSKKTKINHAHSKGGIPLTLATVKKTINLPIHHYIRVNYQALIKTVDDVGGVEVNVPQDMDWDDYSGNLHIHLKAGPQTLNGEQAMQFVRFRQGYANKDLGRIETQQYFLEMLFRKVISPQSIVRIPNYLETMYEYVETDMSKKEILSLAATVIKINPDKIEKKMLPGKAKTINGISYYILDEEAQIEMMDYLLSAQYPDKEVLIPETITEEGEVQEVEKPKYSIFIYNGSGVPKVARRVSDLLKIEDLPVSYSGNASNFDYKQTMIYYKENKDVAKKIKEILEVGKIKEGTRAVDYREPDIVIIIGADFKK